MAELTVEDLVGRAIATIHQRYGEPIHLDDMARSATMSKFYFLRTFHRCTGTTPGRFLSAVRIHRAKHLLRTSAHNVADISVRVGYGSLGAFSRRFTECVGLSPTTYRRMVSGGEPSPKSWRPERRPGAPAGVVCGTVDAAAAVASPILLGLFRDAVPLGWPVAGTMVDTPGSWWLPAVPPGTWHVLAVAGAACVPDPGGHDPGGHDSGERPLLMAVSDALTVRADQRVHVGITIRPPEWQRPPLLVALPGVEVPATAPTGTVGAGRAAAPRNLLSA